MGNWTKWVFVSDTHGDQIDPAASEAFFKFLKLYKPEIRIHGGDFLDVRPFRRGADEEEKRESMLVDLKCGREFIEQLKPTHLTLGNHDIRLWDMAEASKGPLSDFSTQIVSELEELFRSIGCNTVIPYDKSKILEIGKLKCVHGFAHGVTAARKMASVYGSILFGHTHSIQSHSVEGLSNRVAMNTGCLCKINMDYNRANLGSMSQRHGWAYGVLDNKTGEYQAWQAQDINGRWLFATNFKEI